MPPLRSGPPVVVMLARSMVEVPPSARFPPSGRADTEGGFDHHHLLLAPPGQARHYHIPTTLFDSTADTRLGEPADVWPVAWHGCPLPACWEREDRTEHGILDFGHHRVWA